MKSNDIPMPRQTPCFEYQISRKEATETEHTSRQSSTTGNDLEMIENFITEVQMARKKILNMKGKKSELAKTFKADYDKLHDDWQVYDHAREKKVTLLIASNDVDLEELNAQIINLNDTVEELEELINELKSLQQEAKQHVKERGRLLKVMRLQYTEEHTARVEWIKILKKNVINELGNAQAGLNKPPKWFGG